MKEIVLAWALILAACAASLAADPVPLPEAAKTGGMPLLDCLAARSANRDFSGAALTPEQLSGLLWAAGGVNRPSGGLTYPTALNVQDILIYAVTGEGAFLYDPATNALAEVSKGDHRADTGMQEFVASASVNLAFVQDLSKWRKLKRVPPEDAIRQMGAVHAGAAAQNAALFAASQGWAAVVRGSFDPKKMSALLGLKDWQSVIIVQSVGLKK